MTYTEELNDLRAEMDNCDSCLSMRVQGIIPACCQDHLDEQMLIFDKYNDKFNEVNEK
jgi:hypothetical protein